MPQYKKLHILVATFSWGVLLSYLWMAPRAYDRMSRGYGDFSNFYTAGKILQRGQGKQLYDLALQTQVQNEFSEASALRNRALPYMRPPFEALLFVPLCHFPFARAYAIWVVLSMFLVGVTAAYLRSRIPGLAATPWWVYCPLCFSFYPIVFGLILGQDAALVFFLFGLATVKLLEGQDLRAGFWLGLSLIKFQLVLPLLFILFLKKQFRALAGFSLVAAILGTVSLWVVGVKGLSAYPAYLWRLNEKGAAAAIYPSVMPSLRGLVQGWTDPLRPIHSLEMITAALSLALLLWAARQWPTSSARTSKVYLAGLAIVFLATLLAGYHEFGYDLSLVFPIALLAATAGCDDGSLDRTTRRALLFSAAALLCPPLYLLLISAARLNLMAIPLLCLAWGLARAVKIWAAAQANAELFHSATGWSRALADKTLEPTIVPLG